MDKVNLAQKFAGFQETWSPKIVAELNDSYVKLAKLHGEFVWHQHESEDELFLVVKGRLTMQLRDGNLVVDAGELVVVPRGVEHCPLTEEEVQVILIEPKATVNTGDAGGKRTIASQWI